MTSHCPSSRVALAFAPARNRLLALLGCAAGAGDRGRQRRHADVRRRAQSELAAPAAADLPTATDLRDIAPEEAIALNAQIPVAALPATAARLFARQGQRRDPGAGARMPDQRDLL